MTNEEIEAMQARTSKEGNDDLDAGLIMMAMLMEEGQKTLRTMSIDEIKKFDNFSLEFRIKRWREMNAPIV
jgi:hypothetical protein